MLEDDVRRVQAAYPRVWHACHRHQPAGVDLTPRESAILAHLTDGALRRPQRLARHLGIGKSTLSEALDGLVERGLVARRPHEEDRRRVDFELTDDGLRAMSAGSALDPERLAAALSRLTETERAHAVDGLRILAGACLASTDMQDEEGRS